MESGDGGGGGRRRPLNPAAPPFYPSCTTAILFHNHTYFIRPPTAVVTTIDHHHRPPSPPPPPPVVTATSTSSSRKISGFGHHRRHSSSLNPLPSGPRNIRSSSHHRRREPPPPPIHVSCQNNNNKTAATTFRSEREIIPLKPGDGATSVMIRNIPNNYTHLLVEFLENHCKHENQNNEENAVPSAFDFVYLPVDFKHGLNAGYAFVNFTSPEAAWKFSNSVKGKGWDLFQSKKIADVARAKIQGKEALVKHCERMKLLSSPSSDYLPVWFDPPRDGSSMSSSSSSSRKMHVIG